MELTNEQFLPPTRDRDSSENFQKFMLELFEKNGILSDLRAYLRGHIVSVLKNAQVGNPPPCQKLFTQRLDLMYQAVNIIIVEYLFKSEFNYSLSVFVSELPLSNMVFGLAKTIMSNTDLTTLVGTGLKFTNEDVMTVLKHLGIQCDSVHVKRLIEMYNNGKSPLLLCILKCIPLYDAKEVNCDEGLCKGVSEISFTSLSSSHSDSKISWSSRKETCKHLNQCKICQKLVSRLKEKYKMKKEEVKNLTASVKPMNMDLLMKDIGVIEKKLIDEMFHQLKSVYETEIENMRQNESKKLKKTLVTQAMFLQQKRNDLEAAYEKRRQTLENDINQKKKFLWGLAQSLRKQHSAVIQAMKIVNERATALNDQEGKLQTQLKDAENLLEKRSNDIRLQITDELKLLESYLETVKQEKNSVSEARFKLESFKRICEDNTSLKADVESKGDLSERYMSLKNELLNIRDKIENTKSKSDVNELFNNLKDEEVLSNLELNNQNIIDERPSRGSISKVNNELKNNKNCNFEYSTEDPYGQRLSTELFDNTEAVNALRENNRLMELAEETFHQLKSVYETEIENMRQNESKKFKKTLVTQAMFLQQKKNDLEAAYEKRRQTLENDINQKKKFLWGLAQSLRKQHSAVIQAMKIVKERATALNDQEGTLQNQLKDAEKLLEKRSNEIQIQIAKELKLLECYLETVKQEKNSVSEARFKLENFKRICDTSLKADVESQESKGDLSERYKSLKNELLNIRDKIENTKSKSDVNELFNNLKDEEVLSNLELNNQNLVDERPSRDSISKVNNELKNNKNCNFEYSTEDPYCQRLSREMFDNTEAVNALREENKRLMELAEQQRQHINKLTNSEHRLQMELLSARTAAAAITAAQPTTEPFYITMQRASESEARPSCAGEEINVIDPGRRRLTPDDDIPFITGNVHNSSPAQNSRVVRHMSPVRLRSEMPNVTNVTQRPMSAGPAHGVTNSSPAKEKPKKDDKGSGNKTSLQSPVRRRDISPSSVLREAKSRLRKLKIEADAVEQSYLDYKRRQTVEHVDNVDEKSNNCGANKQLTFSSLLDKRYTEFETKCNLGDHFKNKNTAIQIVKPIPKQYCLVMNEIQGDLIEKPLEEFRKLYKSSPPTSPMLVRKISKSNSEMNEENKALMREIAERKNSDITKGNDSQKESKQEVLSEKTDATQRVVNQSKAKNYCQSSTDYTIAPKEDEIDFKDLIAIDMPKYFERNDIVYIESTTCNDANTIFSKDVPSIDTPTPSATVNTFENINSNRDGGDQNYDMNAIENKESVSNETLKDTMMRPGMTIMVTPKFDDNTDSKNQNNLDKDDQLHAIYKNGNRTNRSSDFIHNNGDNGMVIFDSINGDKDIQYSDLSDMNVRCDSADTMKNYSLDMKRKSDDESFWDS